MRSVADDALPGTAVILSGSATADGLGGQTVAFSASGTVACRMSPVGQDGSGGENVAGGEFTRASDWVMTVAYGTDVDGDDRVTYDGTTYEVLYYDAPRSWGISRRVFLRAVS